MKSVLFGNGLIIQYGGESYTNSRIIRRARENVASGRFPKHLYPKECAEALVAFHAEYPAIVRGNYDAFAVATFEKDALRDFKRRYATAPPLAVDQVGLEDYFLIFELLHNRWGIDNPERFHARATLRRMFLDAVFNDGAIQSVHKRFPKGLVRFLREQDRILTTNYDRNLEEVSTADILHLHGAFHTLGAQYDPDSIRYHMSEDLLDGERVDTRYLHLYSSCLVSYVSELKEYGIGVSDAANRALQKFASGYEDDPTIRESIEAWPDSDPLLRRLKEAIRLKKKRPDLAHVQPYPVGELEGLSGSLAIVGLSTRNDGHIFRQLDGNGSLSSVHFYFFDPLEAGEAEALLHSQHVRSSDVRELWAQFEAGT